MTLNRIADDLYQDKTCAFSIFVKTFSMLPGLVLQVIFLTGFTVQNETVYRKALRVGIVGLVHSHEHWILGRENRCGILIVGIAEPSRKLAEACLNQ